MDITKSFKFASTDPGSYKGVYEEPTVCPLCKHAIKPEQLAIEGFKDNEGKCFIAALYLCKSCFQAFVSMHKCHVSHNKYGSPEAYSSVLLYTGPSRFEPKAFDHHIGEISPSFVEIYNQAVAAEDSDLDQIAGMGYRKALEFLIKDYLVHVMPDDAETIKKMELGNCIANKVSNEKLKIVASRSAWLGNDQTHYVQKFADKDIRDLKKFITATVYWISAELTTEEALGIGKRVN